MTQNSLKISRAHEAILIALARFHFLTAAQVSRLLHPNSNDEDRWSQRRLKDLSDSGYAIRLRALPPRETGQPPHVFTLGQKGRKYAKALGIPVENYFRPSEEAKAALNSPFMQHTLEAIDVLISAACLCRDHEVTSPRMLAERELKRGALRVEVPASSKHPLDAKQTATVIPDGWFELQVHDGPTISIALELDRGTEVQRAWRQKVAALAMWAVGPYKEAFETDNLTIAVACPDEKRRDELAGWTLAELTDRRLNLTDIFLFTAAQPAVVTPREFFFAPCWRSAGSEELLSLLDPPAESGVGTIRA
jgi:hypothetical protein